MECPNCEGEYKNRRGLNHHLVSCNGDVVWMHPSGKEYTETKLKAEVSHLKTYKEMADEIGVNYSTFHNLADRLGIETSHEHTDNIRYSGPSRGEKVKQRLRETLNMVPSNHQNHSEEFDKHVYILEGSKSGEVWYYVGQTCNLDSRIDSHIKYNLSSHTSMKVLSLYDVIPVEGDDGVLDLERQVAFQLAIDENTTNILGGR
jgi:predicted GIY-YIG superfamily endonuclease